MKTKTVVYLSIILTAWLVGKICGNPIPLSTYAFYIIVVALFVPYFGLSGCVKIVLCLYTVNFIQDIPFFLTLYLNWPSLFAGIFSFSQVSATTVYVAQYQSLTVIHTLNVFPHPLIFDILSSHANTILALEGNALFTVSLFIGAGYVGILNALYGICRIYKKAGIYNRFTF